MTKRASEDALSELHSALALALAQKINDGSATAADLAVAKGFLKDNGITATLKPGTPLGVAARNSERLDARYKACFDAY